MMDVRAVLTCAISPPCHGSFIESEGMHGTAIGQEADDYHDQLGWFA